MYYGFSNDHETGTIGCFTKTALFAEAEKRWDAGTTYAAFFIATGEELRFEGWFTV